MSQIINPEEAQRGEMVDTNIEPAKPKSQGDSNQTGIDSETQAIDVARMAGRDDHLNLATNATTAAYQEVDDEYGSEDEIYNEDENYEESDDAEFAYNGECNCQNIEVYDDTETNAANLAKSKHKQAFKVNERELLSLLQNWVIDQKPQLDSLGNDHNPLTVGYVGEYNSMRHRIMAMLEAEAERQEEEPDEETKAAAAKAAAAAAVATAKDIAETAKAAKLFSDRYYVQRQKTNCRKWDGIGSDYSRPDLMPFWVADMDFAFVDEFYQKMSEIFKNQALGYGIVPDYYYDNLNKWFSQHYNYTIDPDWLLFTNGVVQGLYSCVQALTEVNDPIMIMTPVYPKIQKAVLDNKRRLIEFPLKFDKKGRFAFDVAGFARSVKATSPKMLILCSPHNPLGKLFSAHEISSIVEICVSNNVILVADEIHQDLVLPGNRFTSVLAAAGLKYQNRVISLNSVSKTFNMAGLVHANLIVPNLKYRMKLRNWQENVAMHNQNILSLAATALAYEVGEEWLDGCCRLIKSNFQKLQKAFKAYPKIRIPKLEATYLAFVDLNAYIAADQLKEVLERDCRLAFSYGEAFGKDYKGWVRINLATSPENVDEMLNRLTAVLETAEEG